MGTSLRSNIRTASEDGYFGGLNAEETEILTQIVERSLIAAGMEPDFQVNAPVSSSRLDVLTFKEGLSEYPSLSALKPGNAAYDPQLDIIFLDVQQITSALSVAENDPFGDAGQMFLVMTILHELGHRKLEGGVFGTLQLVTQGGSSSERNADTFAHRIMAEWTVENQHPFSDVWGNGSETASNFALFSIATISSRAQTKTGFGSYYTSDSHAHLIDRLSGFLRKVLGVQPKGSDAARELQFVENVVSSAGNSESILCELRSQSPIRYFAWSEDALWVLSDDHIYHMPLSRIRAAAKNSTFCFKNLEAQVGSAPPPGTVVAGTFDIDGIVNALTEDGRIWEMQSGDWVETIHSGAEFVHFSTTGPVSNPTIHRVDATSATVWHDTTGRIVHLGMRGPIVFLLDEEIEAFEFEGELSNIDWVLVAARPDDFLLAPSSISGGGPTESFGLLSVGCDATCEIEEHRSYSMENLPSGNFNVVASPGGEYIYATTSHTNLSVVSKMDLWQLHNSSPPKRVASSLLFQDQAGSAELIYYERLYQSLFRWGFATPTTVYVNYVGGDPVLEVDVQTGTVKRPYLQSDLFSYHYGEDLLALSDRTTANIENEAFSIMIIDPHIRSTTR